MSSGIPVRFLTRWATTGTTHAVVWKHGHKFPGTPLIEKWGLRPLLFKIWVTAPVNRTKSVWLPSLGIKGHEFLTCWTLIIRALSCHVVVPLLWSHHTNEATCRHPGWRFRSSQAIPPKAFRPKSDLRLSSHQLHITEGPLSRPHGREKSFPHLTLPKFLQVLKMMLGFFSFSFFFRATLVAYGGSQARGKIRATALA